MSCIVLALSYQQGVLIIHANLRKPETIHNVDTTRYVATTFGWYVDICARSVSRRSESLEVVGGIRHYWPGGIDTESSFACVPI